MRNWTGVPNNPLGECIFPSLLFSDDVFTGNPPPSPAPPVGYRFIPPRPNIWTSSYPWSCQTLQESSWQKCINKNYNKMYAFLIKKRLGFFVIFLTTYVHTPANAWTLKNLTSNSGQETKMFFKNTGKTLDKHG